MLTSTNPHAGGTASAWVRRWSHLAAPACEVLDVACGHGRHMQWFHALGHQVTGLDRDAQALQSAASWGEVLQADLENAAWPLRRGTQVRQFGVVVVTNYLWRPLLPSILASVAQGGLLLYETFADGNQAFGKPSRPEFLLHAGELLQCCAQDSGLQVVAYEQGKLNDPLRCMQRIAAVRSQFVVNLQQAQGIN